MWLTLPGSVTGLSVVSLELGQALSLTSFCCEWMSSGFAWWMESLWGTLDKACTGRTVAVFFCWYQWNWWYSRETKRVLACEEPESRFLQKLTPLWAAKSGERERERNRCASNRSSSYCMKSSNKASLLLSFKNLFANKKNQNLPDPVQSLTCIPAKGSPASSPPPPPHHSWCSL